MVTGMNSHSEPGAADRILGCFRFIPYLLQSIWKAPCLSVGGQAMAPAIRPTFESLIGGFVLFPGKAVREGNFRRERLPPGEPALPLETTALP